MTEATTDDTSREPDHTREALIAEIRAEFGDQVVGHHLIDHLDQWVRFTPEVWGQASSWFMAQGFGYLHFLSGIDWLPSPFGKSEEGPHVGPIELGTDVDPAELDHGYAGGATRFQVMARVLDTTRCIGINVKVDVPDDTLAVPTWSDVYGGANWHEREAAEMFGITFTGHPDPRKLYLPSHFEGHPLRKDFPLLSRLVKPWPGISDAEKIPGQQGGRGRAR